MLHFLYRKLQRLAQKSGFDFVVKRKIKSVTAGSYDYETLLPLASYAPWSKDGLFLDAYAIAKNYTLVDKYRCYELWQLVEESNKLKGALIEVGVWKGGTGALIAKRARLDGTKDTVYLCDTFTGVVKAGGNDSRYKGGEHSDTTRNDVETLTHTFKLDGVKILAGTFPEETGTQVTDTQFRFCHVDVDVFQSAKDVVEWVWPKLVIGGIVVFDDYGFQKCDGVTRYVNEERSKNDRLVIYNLNGHAIFIKLR